MRVKRADDPAAADDTFRQRTLLVRATVLRREQAAVPLTEDSDFLIADPVASALSERDGVDVA